MKKIITLMSALLLTLASGTLYAQKTTTESDYNLRKAYEALNEEKDVDKALDLVSKQLKDTPDNVDALMFRIRIYQNREEFGKALADVNRAIKMNNSKKSGFEQSTLYWWQSYAYAGLGDDAKAATAASTAYKLAQKEKSEYLQVIAFDYGRALYNIGDLDGSDAVFRKMLAEDETDVGAMYGIARNLVGRDRYDEAEQQLLAAIRVRDTYPPIYRLLIQVYGHKGDYNSAIDAAIEYVDKDSDPSWRLLINAGKKNLNYAVANMRAKMKTSGKPIYWRALIAELYYYAGKYELALKENIKLEEEAGKDDRLYERKAECYRHLGMHEAAIAELDHILAKEGDWNAYCERGICYRLLGKFDQAIADFTSAIEEDPRYAFPYYSRGWCYELTGRNDLALKDYNLGIDVDPNYPYIFLERGLVLKKMRRFNEAQADFETAVAKDTVATDGSSTHYALHELNRDEEALAWMQKIIDEDTSDAGNWYDYACLYVRMNRIDDAMKALEKAFELGYRNFGHLEYDYDMDILRDLPSYKALVAKYKAIHEEFLQKSDIPVVEKTEDTISEIAFTRHLGGTFEVPCQINGLPLQMIFDTGASDVTISSVEANFMRKNRYLSDKDIKGKRYYQVATGELSAGAVITLREIMIGDVKLKNVEASVVNNQRAPLLFGQSAMKRFGTITIDNENNKLIIKH